MTPFAGKYQVHPNVEGYKNAPSNLADLQTIVPFERQRMNDSASKIQVKTPTSSKVHSRKKTKSQNKRKLQTVADNGWHMMLT